MMAAMRQKTEKLQAEIEEDMAAVQPIPETH